MNDLLRWPVVATFARSARARSVLQLMMLTVAAAIVAHGLLGPQIAPRNLATVLTWVHYRGLLVIGLLVAGNLFCATCPMILVRDAARRFIHPAVRWPRQLRGKWLAIGLFVAVLFAYERFDLWSLPRATAWLVLLYFAAATVVDVIFRGASFCKYVCPVGQFNLLASTMSPTELRVRRLDTCRSCGTVDCIKGRESATKIAKEVATKDTKSTKATRALRGCELDLFLPAKVGNLDCTLCFDCVRACPHDNIALVMRLPGDELVDDERRSGIGRLTRRADLAALAVVFTFGGLLNAFAMTAPARALERYVATATGTTSATAPLAIVFGLGLLLLPLLVIGGATLMARVLAWGRATSSRDLGLRYAFALVPLGCFVWTAHYLFHFLTGALTAVPVLQQALLDLSGRPLAGDPSWMLTGVRPASVYTIQLGCLVVGASVSIAVAHRISVQARAPRAVLASLPWAAAILLIALAAGWILSQPMEMRGVGFPG